MNDATLIGLAVGFLTYWLVQSDAKLGWWIRFQTWWSNKVPASWNGKPFTCPLCMSFWLSFVIYTYRTLVGYIGAPYGDMQLWLWTAGTTVSYLFASSAISLLFVMLMDKLSITIMK
jgi:hypothetical protein